MELETETSRLGHVSSSIVEEGELRKQYSSLLGRD